MNDFVLLKMVWTLKTFSTDLIKKKKRNEWTKPEKNEAFSIGAGFVSVIIIIR